MKFFKREDLKIISSVMDVIPAGDYREYLPAPQAELMSSYWEEAGKYLGNAIEQHNQAETHCQDGPDRRITSA